jgi:hypothetical protein
MYRFLLPVVLFSCKPEDASTLRHAQPSASVTDVDTDSAWRPEDTAPGEPGACGFTYASDFRVGERRSSSQAVWGPVAAADEGVIGEVAYLDPAPPRLISASLGGASYTLPDYSDSMPLFERAQSWGGKTRCFETPLGAHELDESSAYALYRTIAEKTTGIDIDTTPGVRTIIGIRGAWPGTFAWHGNAPNRFNDTLVVLWSEGGERHVREYPVNTEPGDHDFGHYSSSSLRPNRRYFYSNSWHRSYNAMRIEEHGYRVQDDSNANGHWDSDRNGWRDGGTLDHERGGSGHNIHAASVNGPLGTAPVENWSAGCQTIPGIDNWTQFMADAWQAQDEEVQYFLIDARDIDPLVWDDCTPDGSHGCPFRITDFPFTDRRSTATAGSRVFDEYNCDDANESGPELVYVFTTDVELDLSVTVDSDPSVDVDIHLLEGDDANACLARAHISLDEGIGPGRYLLVIDTWVDRGEELSGDFTLEVSLD